MNKKMMEAIGTDLKAQKSRLQADSDRLKDYFMLVDKGYVKYDKGTLGRVLEYPAGRHPQVVSRPKRSDKCNCCGAPRSDPMQGTPDCFYCGSHLTPG